MTKERGAAVRFPPPLVFLAALLGGIAVHIFVAHLHVPLADGLRLPLGIAVLATGLGFVAPARLWFVKTGQCPTPWSPTPRLIENGPYRVTRNPMYVGITLVLIGIALTSNVVWIALLAPVALACVHVIAVLPEERYLARKFGESYVAYKARVRRYL